MHKADLAAEALRSPHGQSEPSVSSFDDEGCTEGALLEGQGGDGGGRGWRASLAPQQGAGGRRVPGWRPRRGGHRPGNSHEADVGMLF